MDLDKNINLTDRVSPPAIEIKNLSKKFRVYQNRESQLKYVVLNLLKGRRSRLRAAFWALKDIDITIRQGQTVGFIGRNGSGKSTLLKLVSRILFPDVGTIETHGRISTLIELGAGFHPELTGRENVYINASILGFSRAEVNLKFKDIIQFSGLEDFIDNPVKTYSSGMYVRLGFSVAINIEPDILLVDEVLAVGDETFQKKCVKKIHELKKAGKTIVFVSHDLSTIEALCDTVYLMHNGRLVTGGKPVDVISQYHRLLVGSNDFKVRQENESPGEIELIANGKNRWGSKEIEITGVDFLDGNEKKSDCQQTNEPLHIRIHYKTRGKVDKPVFGIAIYTESGVHITGPNTKKQHFSIESAQGVGCIDYYTPSLPLLPGTYLVSVAVYDWDLAQAYDHWEQHWKIHVIESENVAERLGLITIPATWSILHDNWKE